MYVCIWLKWWTFGALLSKSAPKMHQKCTKVIPISHASHLNMPSITFQNYKLAMKLKLILWSHLTMYCSFALNICLLLGFLCVLLLIVRYFGIAYLVGSLVPYFGTWFSGWQRDVYLCAGQGTGEIGLQAPLPPNLSSWPTQDTLFKHLLPKYSTSKENLLF